MVVVTKRRQPLRHSSTTTPKRQTPKNTATMETFKIEPTDNGELTIECPKCDFWENAPEDIPRRKLDIVTSVSNDGRYTDCQCPECLHKWRLDWNEAL